jgi:transcriptional regulator with XRE-family HTH domain
MLSINAFYVKMFLVSDNFGFWLQREREKRGLTQAKLAAKAGLNRAVINKIENGQSEPSPETLQAIADALNIPDEVVFRAAGYLRSSANTEYQEELLHLFSQLSQDEQDEIIELLRFKAERQKSKPKPPSREQKPARTLLKEK